MSTFTAYRYRWSNKPLKQGVLIERTIMQIKKGMNRVVLLIGRYAIKFPRYIDHQSFVRGILSNILESVRWKRSHHPALMPVLFTFPFGLLSIQERCDYILPRKLTQEEIDILPFVTVDNNGNNAGIHKGRIVVFDYGSHDMKLKEQLC